MIFIETAQLNVKKLKELHFKVSEIKHCLPSFFNHIFKCTLTDTKCFFFLYIHISNCDEFMIIFI